MADIYDVAREIIDVVRDGQIDGERYASVHQVATVLRRVKLATIASVRKHDRERAIRARKPDRSPRRPSDPGPYDLSRQPPPHTILKI